MMKKAITTVLFANFLQAQETIQLDRPDQTESVYVVPKNYLQTEMGFMFEKTNRENNHFHLPTILWKYGFNDKVELRVITEFSLSTTPSSSDYELQPISLGFKTSLLEEKGIFPKIAFIGKAEVRKSEILQRKTITPAFRFTFQNNFNPKTSLGYNLGMFWNEDLHETYLYTLALGKSISPKLNYFVEIYGFVSPNQTADTRLNGGFTYLINDNFMLDTSSGIGLSEISAKYFFSFGLSYRLKLQK